MPSEKDEKFQRWLRILSLAGRGTNGPTVGQADLDASVEITLPELVADLKNAMLEEGNRELVQRFLPALSRIFTRHVALAQPAANTCATLLAILRLYLAFDDDMLHDADRSLHMFFRSFLSKQYADSLTGSAVLKFLTEEKQKLLLHHHQLLAQFYPLILKLLVCNSTSLEASNVDLVQLLIGPASFLPLFSSLLALPILALALDDLEQTAGSLPGAAPAAAPKGPEPEDLFALMDAGFIGFANAQEILDAEQASQLAAGKAGLTTLYKELLGDENQGLTDGQWAAGGIQAAMKSTLEKIPGDRLSHALALAPQMLRTYFMVALQDISNEVGALVSMIFEKVDNLFPDATFQKEVLQLCIRTMLDAFQRYPHMLPLLKKPVMDIIGQPWQSPVKAELAMHLSWAIGEHGAGGEMHKEAAGQLFECLELVLYENLTPGAGAASQTDGTTSSRVPDGVGDAEWQHGRGRDRERLLCFTMAAIAKLATWHIELYPRARLCLSKVARSQQYLERRVWQRARDYLGLMRDPALCASLLGPQWSSSTGQVDAPELGPSLPFYLLRDKTGIPFHDFSFADILY